MMNIENGRHIDLVGHIKQSIKNILFTALGSRVMREEYGSLLPELIDRPTNDVLVMQLTAATYVAIKRWEPRISLEQITITHHTNGLTIDLLGSINGEAIEMSIHQ